MANLSLNWTKHIKDPEKKEAFEASIRASTTALSRLKEILEEEETNLNIVETSINDFDVPNWEARQAFRNGMRLQIRRTKELLNF